MQLDGSSISCGVLLLSHMNYNQTKPEQLLSDVSSTIEEDWREERGSGEYSFSHIVYSDVVSGREKGIGADFTKLILSLDVGSVVSSAIKTNPNSGNKIRVWTWAVNHDKLRAWANKQ